MVVFCFLPGQTSLLNKLFYKRLEFSVLPYQTVLHGQWHLLTQKSWVCHFLTCELKLHWLPLSLKEQQSKTPCSFSWLFLGGLLFMSLIQDGTGGQGLYQDFFAPFLEKRCWGKKPGKGNHLPIKQQTRSGDLLALFCHFPSEDSRGVHFKVTPSWLRVFGIDTVWPGFWWLGSSCTN